jgi:hypothetical protein
MTTESLKQSYAIEHSNGDFREHACESCAEEFAETHGLTWNWNRNFTEDSVSGFHAYNMLWDSGETDYPVSCSCGQYLDVTLTRDGREYMLSNDFPEWLYEAHGVTR